jgi:hypothetical protein
MTIGNPEFIQALPYTAANFRGVAMDTCLQEGVVLANDLKVVQRGAGANMSVDVGAGSCWVQGDTTARQGLYHAYSDAVTNLVIGANASGNPRIDQVILTINDATYSGASNNGVLSVLAGTPTAAATLANRNGAATLTATSIRLADVLVANGAASILTASIQDRRQWARGVYALTTATTSGPAINTGAATLVPEMTLTLECSGAPIQITFSSSTSASAAQLQLYAGLWVDGANTDAAYRQGNTYSTGAYNHVGIDHTYTALAAGRHTFEARAFSSGAGTFEGLRRQMVIREFPGLQSAQN